MLICTSCGHLVIIAPSTKPNELAKFVNNFSKVYQHTDFSRHLLFVWYSCEMHCLTLKEEHNFECLLTKCSQNYLDIIMEWVIRILRNETRQNVSIAKASDLYSFRISVMKPTILSEGFRGFSQFTQEIQWALPSTSFSVQYLLIPLPLDSTYSLILTASWNTSKYKNKTYNEEHSDL
jgi:hypothetical protein